ncbi:MAG TPA: cation-translocating P-type ATPase [Phycisphaerales bacterium]|nr:cation-translocating P-type ATPase [Phycisphaerales bacterium]HMP37200.1 cation-translocating P-type ATPase [Phycisphaerales bacterium]
MEPIPEPSSEPVPVRSSEPGSGSASGSASGWAPTSAPPDTPGPTPATERFERSSARQASEPPFIRTARASIVPPRGNGTDRTDGRPGFLDRQLVVAIAAGATLAIGWLLSVLAGSPGESLPGSLGLGLLLISLALGSIYGVPAALESVRARRPDIDFLMVLGAYCAAAIGHPEDGALLLFMFTLAGGLEHRAMAKAKDAVARLSRLMPRAAVRREGAEWVEVDAEALAPDDIVMVRPGESIPADGVVLAGRSHVDQSSLTGESLPRSVGLDDSVFAGTINQEGPLEVRVLRAVAESSIRRILTLVLEAQERRQPMQRVVDRFSAPYATTVMLGSALAFFAFWRLGSLAPDEALYRAITLLVVASPCALVIATPTATLCGLSRAARNGVLIKGGDALERLGRVRRLAVDKTGTLTTGRIEVTRVEPIGPSDISALLRVAMAAEQRSTHPIAAAVVRLAAERRLEPLDLAELSNVPGRGIEGSREGQPVRIGTYPFCEPLIPICFRRHTARIVESIRAQGGMAIVVAWGNEALVLGLADRPREGAAELAGSLRRIGVSEIAMLTGDHRTTAERVARELGIDEVHAELLPEGKVEALERMRDQAIGHAHAEGTLAVVGDGINDAPALAVADVGLAMGAIGADAALETADVVLLHDDLARIPWSIGLARRVRRIMLANLLFAIAVIAALATLTLLGSLPLGLGVVGHEGSTLLVVANSLRILAHRS